MNHIWIEAVIIGACIGVAVILVQTLAPDSILLRVGMLIGIGIVLSLLQYGLTRWRRRHE